MSPDGQMRLQPGQLLQGVLGLVRSDSWTAGKGRVEQGDGAELQPRDRELESMAYRPRDTFPRWCDAMTGQCGAARPQRWVPSSPGTQVRGLCCWLS